MTLTLIILQTSPACLSFRLQLAGRVVFTTRAYAELEASREAARARCERWATARGYTVVEAATPGAAAA